MTTQTKIGVGDGRFLTREEIAALNGVELKRLVERGILFVKTQQPERIDKMRKEDLPVYQKYNHLAGVPIGIGEAARKYNIPQGTVSRWVARGIIKKIGREKNKVLLNEQDVAYCADIRLRHKGKVRWMFNPDGTPYIATTMNGRHKEEDGE